MPPWWTSPSVKYTQSLTKGKNMKKKIKRSFCARAYAEVIAKTNGGWCWWRNKSHALIGQCHHFFLSFSIWLKWIIFLLQIVKWFAFFFLQIVGRGSRPAAAWAGRGWHRRAWRLYEPNGIDEAHSASLGSRLSVAAIGYEGRLNSRFSAITPNEIRILKSGVTFLTL